MLFPRLLHHQCPALTEAVTSMRDVSGRQGDTNLVDMHYVTALGTSTTNHGSDAPA